MWSSECDDHNSLCPSSRDDWVSSLMKQNEGGNHLLFLGSDCFLRMSSERRMREIITDWIRVQGTFARVMERNGERERLSYQLRVIIVNKRLFLLFQIELVLSCCEGWNGKDGWEKEIERKGMGHELADNNQKYNSRWWSWSPFISLPFLFDSPSKMLRLVSQIEQKRERDRKILLSFNES